MLEMTHADSYETADRMKDVEKCMLRYFKAKSVRDMILYHCEMHKDDDDYYHDDDHHGDDDDDHYNHYDDDNKDDRDRPYHHDERESCQMPTFNINFNGMPMIMSTGGNGNYYSKPASDYTFGANVQGASHGQGNDQGKGCMSRYVLRQSFSLRGRGLAYFG